MSWLRERSRAAGWLVLWLTASTACGGDARKGVPAAPGAPDDRDAASAPDAGKLVVSPGPVAYEVPAGGGATTVMASDGTLVVFDFPASAAGTPISLTPIAASAIGWPDEQFAQVIRMEPDGMQFEHPVLVRPGSRDAIVLAFASGGQKGPAQGLPLNLAGDGFLLAHFSTLVVVPPASSCDRQSGWVVSDETTSGKRCTERKFPSYITFNCTANAYCVKIEAQCCADAKATACHLGDPQLSVRSEPAQPDERYRYCRGPGDAGRGGTGPGDGAGGQGGEAGSSLADAGEGEAGSGAGSAGAAAAGSGGAGGEVEGSGGSGGTVEGGSGGVGGEAEAGSGGEGQAGAGGELAAGSGGEGQAGGGELAAGSSGGGEAGSEGGAGDDGAGPAGAAGDAEAGAGGADPEQGGEAGWPEEEAGTGGVAGDQGA